MEILSLCDIAADMQRWHLSVSVAPRSVRVSCKFWHMLINLCFHVSLTCGVFVGGINQTRHASACQAVSVHHLCASTLPAVSASISQT